MHRRAIWILFLHLVWVPTSVSFACSLAGEYVRPTNFELVQMSDAIVVASAVKETGVGSSSTVRFRVRETLKGSPPAEFDTSFAFIGKPIPSDPQELTNPNAEAFRGPCIRRTFAKGSSYVMFLVKDDQGNYQQLDYPFTRANEDYFGPNSLWAQTIKSYLDIQEHFSAMDQLVELERVMRLKHATSSRKNQKQAMDILDHLQSRSPFKPTEYLVTTYETLERGEAPRFALRSPSEDQEKSEAQILTNAIFGAAAPDALNRPEQMEFVLRSLVKGHHPAGKKLFDRLLSSPSISPRTLGLALRFLAKNGELERAFDLMQARALSLLPILSASDGEALIGDIASAMRNWSTHPRISAQWPEIALGLYWYQYHSFGADHVLPFRDELDSLPMTDYRARPELTLARAKSVDRDIKAWAIAELSNETQRVTYEAQRVAYEIIMQADGIADDPVDPAVIPMQALVLSYGKERNTALLQAFCQSDTRRALLIRSLGEWADSFDGSLLARIGATPELTKDERDMLGRAVAAIYGRQVETARRLGKSYGWLYSGGDWYELLKKLLGNEASDAKPIVCKPDKSSADLDTAND